MLVIGDGSFSAVSSVLCLGAHSDDIEIGCGATISKLVAANPKVTVHWLVLSAEGRRADEARAAADVFLSGGQERRVQIEGFRERYFDHLPELKEYFDDLGSRIEPDLILTHRRADAHQDHRVVADLTWNTFRDHLVLEYEIPKYEGDLGHPNVFVHLDEEAAHRKARAIVEGFPSQVGRYWFTEETFLGLLRLRGIEARSPGGYAEAFHGRKLILV